MSYDVSHPHTQIHAHQKIKSKNNIFLQQVTAAGVCLYRVSRKTPIG